ncbi:MAG: CoA transferase [Proteobacteria bacterium]|nr:CoA transferase [Pseudomonadota bacterium]
MTKPLRPLEGIRVLDLSRYLPGPLLTRALADLGAEVVKIEAPRGEGMRYLPPHVDGVGAAFGALNAGKASVALNLKDPTGTALFLELVDAADIVVESLRPGVLARLGLAPESLMERNPRLIIASLTGYGQHGSLSAAAGHDLNYLAHAGLLSLFGPTDGPPAVPGVQIADVGGGSLPGTIAVLAALLERSSTGVGRHLDISLTRGSLAFAAVAFPTAVGGMKEPRGGGMLTGGAPCYRCYATQDDRYVAVGALEPHFFANLCAGLGAPELARHGYATGTQAVEAIEALQALFSQRTQAEWLAHFEGQDVCLTAVRTPEEALADPEFAAVHADVGGFHTLSVDRGDARPLTSTPPSPLGADARAVTSSWGVSDATRDQAAAAGALVLPEESS